MFKLYIYLIYFSNDKRVLVCTFCFVFVSWFVLSIFCPICVVTFFPRFSFVLNLLL